jgi:formylglycine-generating enzyme required for sulfatase activity
MQTRITMKRSFRRLLGVVGMFVVAVTLLATPVVADSPPPTSTASAAPIVAKDFRGFEMVYVPGGTFQMGITRDSLDEICLNVLRDGDENDCNDLVDIIGSETGIFQTHSVELPSFWMDRYEVTIEQYQVCINSGPGRACQPIELPSPDLQNNPHKPQLGVNWYDAVYFCNTRSARLPTEAEWEYAARGPKGFYFPWGNTFDDTKAGPAGSTYPVGSIAENRSWAGINDLAGNAAEWVDDLARPYLSSVNWPQGFPMYDTYRVARGGSWANRTFHLLTFSRQFISPFEQDQTIGFRCARTSDPRQ